MKPHLIVGILGVAAAIILSCVAGIYAATNPAAALATAATACIALVVGVNVWCSTVCAPSSPRKRKSVTRSLLSTSKPRCNEQCSNDPRRWPTAGRHLHHLTFAHL